MKKKLCLGDCLEILPTLPENKIDTCITDPPYFLVDDSGSGFMGKEWDGIIGLWKYLWNDEQFVSFVAKLLNATQVEKSMEGENIVLKSVNTIPEEKKTSNNANIVGRISNTQIKTGNSVQEIAITKDVLLDLLSELSSNHTKTLEKYLDGEGRNVLFVIPILLHQPELKNTVQKIVTTLLKVSELEEAKITFTKMEAAKRKDFIEGMIGILSEKESTREIVGDVDIVENIVLIKKSNVTTLNHTGKIKIIQNITLLLCAYLAIRLWSKMSDILIETFFKVAFQEVFRTLKPGGLVMAFGGTRTWHKLAKSIEDAGFEIRDTICWLYGSGFPKSYNIGKGIDKKAGKEREAIGTKLGQPGYSLTSAENQGNTLGWSKSKRDGDKKCEITAPATLEAELWEGWGTALKPAFEPIIIAMKPKDGTFVDNALKHGVAGMWIDGGRIALPENEDGYTINTWDDNAHPFGDGAGNPYTGRQETQGRWPANLILDEEASKLLDKQTGNLGKSSGGGQKDLKSGKLFMGDTHPNITDSTGFGDSGGASRFFYCAKVNKKERNLGLGDVKTGGSQGNRPGSPDTDSGKFPDHDHTEKGGNIHPTVKPLELMKYLVRLTKTPTGGIVLDPFMGSGTTGMACALEGRDFIGIEMNEEYYEIAKLRIKAALTQD